MYPLPGVREKLSEKSAVDVPICGEKIPKEICKRDCGTYGIELIRLSMDLSNEQRYFSEIDEEMACFSCVVRKAGGKYIPAIVSETEIVAIAVPVDENGYIVGENSDELQRFILQFQGYVPRVQWDLSEVGAGGKRR